MAAWRLVARAHGGPEVIAREDFDPGAPGPGEALVAQDAVGLNFIDTYVRSGLYATPLPAGLGAEAAGHVIAVGEGVTTVAVGDRVAYAAGPHGSYATHRIYPANRLLKLPDAISNEDAAATMLKGMTACFLAEDCAKVQPGQTVVVHAAAGGVGSLLVPWLVDKGVRVIAHAGNAEKAAQAKANGAQEALHCALDDLGEEVRRLTNGEGVDVVFDGVGKASWAASIASLRRRGLMVSYGNASGPVAPVNLLDLSRGGSLYVTRPTLFDYVHTDAEYRSIGERLFDRMTRGVIRADIRQRFALADAADAHRALEARQTTGSTILLP